jgi:O-antigen ligase
MILESAVYVLPSWAIIPILLAGMVIVFKGKPEWVAGFYVSVMTWSNNVQFGSLSVGWVIVFFLCVAIIRSILSGKVKWSNARIVLSGIVLLCFLFGWMLSILLLIPIDTAIHPGLQSNLLQKLVLYIALPIVSLSLFGNDLSRIKAFMISFAITTLVGGSMIFLLDVTKLGWDIFLRQGPLSGSLYMLGRTNYHQYGATFVMALIFLIGLLISYESFIASLALVVGSVWLVYLCILTGSRQVLSGILIASLLYVLFVIFIYKRKRLLILLMGMGVTILFILVAPSFAPLAYKLSPDQIDGSRLYLWKLSYSMIIGNPNILIFGGGFTDINIAHNLFLESWLVTGLVGLVLLLMFLAWVLTYTTKSLRILIVEKRLSFLCWYIPLFIAYIYTIYAAQAIGNLVNGYYIYWGGYLLVLLGSSQVGMPGNDRVKRDPLVFALEKRKQLQYPVVTKQG